jgi:hypothetical protein
VKVICHRQVMPRYQVMLGCSVMHKLINDQIFSGLR